MLKGSVSYIMLHMQNLGWILNVFYIDYHVYIKSSLIIYIQCNFPNSKLISIDDIFTQLKTIPSPHQRFMPKPQKNNRLLYDSML